MKCSLELKMKIVFSVKMPPSSFEPEFYRNLFHKKKKKKKVLIGAKGVKEIIPGVHFTGTKVSHCLETTKVWLGFSSTAASPPKHFIYLFSRTPTAAGVKHPELLIINVGPSKPRLSCTLGWGVAASYLWHSICVQGWSGLRGISNRPP